MHKGKFGVCFCEMDPYGIDAEIKDLEIFDTYDEAYEVYMKRSKRPNNSIYIDPNIWLVWIKPDNTIEQLDQLKWVSKSKMINIQEQINSI